MKGNRLTELRIQNNRTQKELSTFLGVTRKTYRNYEKGTIDFRTIEASMLADLYNVSIEYLIGKSKSMKIIRKN